MQIGERIRFTESNRDAHIRSGDFATVERIGGQWLLSVRLDNGKSVEFGADHARHIDYGYAVETAERATADRVLVTGDASQLAQQQEAFTHLATHTRDLAMYTSDSRELGMEKAVPGAEIAPSLNELSGSLDNLHGHNMELPGLGIRS